MDLPTSPTECVRFVMHDGWLDLVLDRPSHHNALSIAMYQALSAGLTWASTSKDARVVRIRGVGPSFSSGNDLADFQQNIPGEDGGPIGDFLRILASFEKPLVAGVQGHAVGIGTTMLLHCDLAVAASTTSFRLPFVKLGLVPEAGSSYLLPLLAGHRRAAALLMLGQSFDAATALDCGIINEVLPIEGDASPESVVDARSAALASQLVDLPTGALQATKRLMKTAHRPTVEAAMQAEGREFIARLSSPEAMEAFLAFFEKRQPDFRKI